MIMNDVVYYTANETAALLRCSRDKLYEMARAKQLPRLKVGGTWLFPVKDVLAWVESKTEKATD
jgi:excisionase family DNA binding protein